MSRTVQARAVLVAAVLATLAAPALSQTGPSQSLTITPQQREQRALAISDADLRALDAFSRQPSLAPAPGLSIGRAYGPHDEDCVRAGGEVFCRQ